MAQRLESFDFDNRTHKRRYKKRVPKAEAAPVVESPDSNGSAALTHCDLAFSVRDRKVTTVKLMDTAEGYATLLISKTGIRFMRHGQRKTPEKEISFNLLASLCEIGL